MSVIIGLTCFHCGKTVQVEVPQQPRFAFEVAQWADDAGMLGVLDMSYGRALVFCDTDHARKELTKRGTYRFRAKGPAKEAA